MRLVGISIIFIVLIASFACTDKQSKKVTDTNSPVKKPTSVIPETKKPDKTEKKEFLTCESIVTGTLMTSPRYKQLTKGLYMRVIKNGGQSFGISLEGSPDPNRDKAHSYSKNYDFIIYETYTDRRLNTARFSFNPQNKQLYEFDAVNDKLKPIEFDRNLLLKFESLCK